MYQWTIQDVFRLLAISYPEHRKEVEVTCPFCGSKHFSMNMYKGIGHCWKCGKGADSASFYATVKGMSLRDARKDIEENLNITNDWKTEKIPPRIVYKEPESTPLAPIEVRDKTYRAFLEELVLSEKNINMLLARGFNKSTIQALNYKTFPARNEVDYFALCRRLLADGNTLRGVPGFFQTKNGDWTFVTFTKGIIMPCMTINNEIAFLQIRKDDDLRIFIEEKGKFEAKCSWFSSDGLKSGTKANADVHFACDMIYNGNSNKYWPVAKETFALTEGFMKGDLIHDLMPNIPVICVAGVRSYVHLRKALQGLRALGVKRIMHCFDMDYRTNPNVAEPMEEVKRMIKEEGFEYIFQGWETKIQVEGKIFDLLNGMDDYLAYRLKGVVPKIKEKN